MSLWMTFWRDERGSVVSAEAVVVGVVGVAGATVGMSAASQAIDAEMQDVAHAIRSLDQSYSLRGFNGTTAGTAASRFTQQDVARSRAELDAYGRQWAQPNAIPATPRPSADNSATDQRYEPPFPAAL